MENAVVGPLIDRQKEQLELRKKDARKLALLRSILSHFIGIFTALVELYLGYKVNLRDRE